MSSPKEPRGPSNPKIRSTVYTLAALYLAYLYYEIAKPFLTGDPYGPSTLQFVLGTVALGGGAVAVGFLAWKLYKAPLPEEDSEEPPEEDGEEPSEE